MNEITPPKLMPPFHSQGHVADRAYKAEHGHDRADQRPPDRGENRMPVQEQPLPESVRHPRAYRPGDQQAPDKVFPDGGPLHHEHVRHRREPLRGSQSAPEAAVGLDGHVHRGVAFHRPGNALVGLLRRLTQEPLAKDDSKHQGDEHDDDRAADELGEGELPAQQKEHDDAELKDQVGRGDLERHGGREVRPLAKQRPRQCHGGIRA